VRVQRVVVRDGVDAAAARQLMATQASREARLALADDVIVNEGSLEELADRVMALDRLYRMLAHPSQAG
jgi:dephospho-CoA kinase